MKYEYTDFGKVKSITDGTETQKYKYNGFGDVVEVGNDITINNFSYDIEGRLTSKTVRDKKMGEVKNNYTYDKRGNVTSIETGMGTEYITYDKAGRKVKKENNQSGVSKTYLYYVTGLVKDVITKQNDEILYTENYEYDPNGNKIYENLNGEIKKYAYDGMGRLKTVADNEGRITEYEFDNFGNISKEYDITERGVKTKQHYYDNLNRLILSQSPNETIKYEYDNSGNLTEKTTGRGKRLKTENYRYDGYNRLNEYISDGKVAEYTYNLEGLRESKKADGKYTRYVYDGMDIIGELNDTENYIYYRGTELIGYKDKTGTPFYYRTDNHGNVVSISDYLGKELKNYTYNAYGKTEGVKLNSNGEKTVIYQWKSENEKVHNPFGYCGEYTDPETGFIYLRNRYYDPTVGRFITEDPVRSGTNWYVYANNNPVNYIDPLGLDAIIITNKNSVGIEGVVTAGHTSAIYQGVNGEWYYTYWGNKAAAVIRIPNTYIKEYRRDGDIVVKSMNSLTDFNNSLNNFLSSNDLKNITSNYTNATYIVGDFTASLNTAYDDVNNAYINKHSKGTLITLSDGSKIFQGHNSPYNMWYRNCFDKTYDSLSKGTLANGTNVGTYMNELEFKGGLIPNKAISKFSEVFMNSSFTYEGAYSNLSNYATLYKQKSSWARKKSKASYANAVIGR